MLLHSLVSHLDSQMRATVTTRKSWLAMHKTYEPQCRADFLCTQCRCCDVFRQQYHSRVCHSLGFFVFFFLLLLYCVLFSLGHASFMFAASHVYFYFASALFWHRIRHCQDFTHHSVFLVPSVPSLPHLCIAMVWLRRHLSPSLPPMRFKGLGRVRIFLFFERKWRHCCYNNN